MSSDEDFDDSSGGFSSGSSDAGEANPFEDQYYEGKDLKNSSANKALETFKEMLIEMEGKQAEENVGEYYFKTLKQIVKISFALNNHEEALQFYQKLLQCVNKPPCGVSPNSLDSMLQKMQEKAKNAPNYSSFVDCTFEVIDPNQNQNMWSKLALNTAENLLQSQQFEKLEKILNSIHKQCLTPEGKDDVIRKGTRLKQMHALKMQMCLQKNDIKSLRGLYNKCVAIEAAVPPAAVTGVIQECGGRVAMKDGRYEDAKTCFFKAFQAFDHAADIRRKNNLKYHVLAVMLQQKHLGDTNINPFDADEAQTYRNDPEIKPMSDLFEAHSKQDSTKFTNTLNNSKQHIYNDQLIREYVEEMMEVFQSQVICKMLLPYKHVKISFISKKLKITDEEVKFLLISMILNEEIKAVIEEATGMVTILEEEENEQLTQLQKWHETIKSANSQIGYTMKVSY